MVSRSTLPPLPEDEQQLNNVLNTLESHGLIMETPEDGKFLICRNKYKESSELFNFITSTDLNDHSIQNILFVFQAMFLKFQPKIQR